MKKLVIYISLVLFGMGVITSCKSSKGCAQGDDVSKYQKEVRY